MTTHPTALRRAAGEETDTEAARVAKGLTAAQRKALVALDAAGASEEFAVPFRAVVATGLLEASKVRLHVRALARRGLAEFRRGLCTEGGEFAGSGYGLTPLGVRVRALTTAKEPPK